MTTLERLNLLIGEAEEIAGGVRPLARLLDMNPSNLLAMKKGERPCNWRIRGKLRAILGEDPAHAFMAAMAEDLEQSENEDEKKAANSFKSMLEAFPDDIWRKRMIPLGLAALEVLSRLSDTIHSPFCHVHRHPELQA